MCFSLRLDYPQRKSIAKVIGLFMQVGTPTKKGYAVYERKPLTIIRRDGGIRTHDPLPPRQVHYRAVLHPEQLRMQK